ncbi:MAG: YlbF family regulator [Lactobacillales bacterium]|jgi:cell fate (sporulation/competence/biofilm development) regulator YlbF (YheA/YmcA/DUF963 family)|nr:YlbF family regulator [Lactobacillales bacterium]
MIITETFFNIEDQTKKLIEEILKSDSYNHYCNKRKSLFDSTEVKEKQQDFLEKKRSFEKVEEYGKFAPDYKEKQRAVRVAKRALDLHEEVAEFRQAETGLQNILDTVVTEIAETISKDIKVDVGNPFFIGNGRKNHHCGGGCQC